MKIAVEVPDSFNWDDVEVFDEIYKVIDSVSKTFVPTGEYRIPEENEYFLGNDDNLKFNQYNRNSKVKRFIYKRK